MYQATQAHSAWPSLDWQMQLVLAVVSATAGKKNGGFCLAVGRATLHCWHADLSGLKALAFNLSRSCGRRGLHASIIVGSDRRWFKGG